MDVETADVIKCGETVIRIVLHRNSNGLTVQVKTHPGVEDFMRMIGNGEKVDPGIVGRYWVPVGNEKNLAAYMIPALKPPSNGIPMTVDALGHPLLIMPDKDMIIRGSGTTELVNISFLRLVGVSEGIGITFGVKGVFSKEQLTTLRDKLATASRVFYIEYMQPIDLGVTINTSELRY